LINPEWIWSNTKINPLREEANTALGKLGAFPRIVPNVELFIRMHIVKEATDSSRSAAKARFVPPSPEEVLDLTSDLEAFFIKRKSMFLI
jgi:hypothetical protein